MPIKPYPLTFVCDDCHWKKTVTPRSDALKPGEWLAQCPTCGSEALTLRRAGALAGSLAEWRAWLRRF